MVLNVGPTRADNITGVQKIEYPTGSVLPDVANRVLYVTFFFPFFVCVVAPCYLASSFLTLVSDANALVALFFLTLCKTQIRSSFSNLFYLAYLEAGARWRMRSSVRC